MPRGARPAGGPAKFSRGGGGRRRGERGSGSNSGNKPTAKTQDELDAELDRYMNQGTTASGDSMDEK